MTYKQPVACPLCGDAMMSDGELFGHTDSNGDCILAKLSWMASPAYLAKWNTRPASPAPGDVEAVAEAVYTAMHGANGGRWECVEPRYQKTVWGKIATAAITAMTERDRALREAALRVLSWADQVAGDNRRPNEAAEELASVHALAAILASTGDADNG